LGVLFLAALIVRHIHVVTASGMLC